MAMPVAMGIEETMKGPNGTPTTSPWGLCSTSPPNIQVSVRATAEANHLICCRSFPLALRKRRKRETMGSSPASSISGNPACKSARSHPGTPCAFPPPSSSSRPL